jgi:hypothetical protein
MAFRLMKNNYLCFVVILNIFLKASETKYSEEVVMMAPSQNTQGHDLFHSLWINAGSTTWTFIVVNKQVGVTCILASGDNMKMMLPPGI